MEAFFRTHTYLVEHTNAPVRRTLMDEIDWNDRLIGIKGSRGIGKTSLWVKFCICSMKIIEQKEDKNKGTLLTLF